MRIGVNTLFHIPGEVGGSETYLIETLKALMTLGHGDELVLFTHRDNQETLFPIIGTYPGVFFQSLEFSARNRPARILREQFQLPHAVKRWQLDVLWSPGYTAPLRAPCPQALSILDMQYITHPEDLSAAARMASHVLIQLGARAVDRVITISEFSKSEIIRHTGIRPEKITVTPLGVDPAFGISNANEDPFIAPPYLLCVAHSYPHKNIAALIQAFAQLQDEIPHRLVLVGKPRRGEQQVRQALAAIRNADRLIRLADLTKPRLISLYQHADAFIFPSRYEGFGLPVLEAMMAGAPVLTARRCAIPEIALDTVEYFDPDTPGDLALQLRSLLVSRPNKVEQARRRASQFTWERTARLTREALCAACAI